ncbi:hypothetical protein AVEN_249287-1 [Araneus ventricosus]|uniref:Uncharacterized protein n=1 Tax=Araneus ventricosus TaxID=182803 RepID=A0A4Y2AGW3_ARAVE|nr:hypothetical protein AVEN_232914-1 [Araneus ventricosus]GBL79101.1 hypothetical protein AVEN_89315-1 [Araneus ventricosus]GBL79190.1 hypothetical protein AVEN_248188-1 [Araneus ventricosus]GBL79195.1 hypothetical protein AVEN_249287-1 [Araneus ventricosus]
MTKTTSELAPPPQTSTPHQREHMTPMEETCIGLAYMVVIRWNWVSKLEPCGPEAESLPFILLKISKRKKILKRSLYRCFPLETELVKLR